MYYTFSFIRFSASEIVNGRKNFDRFFLMKTHLRSAYEGDAFTEEKRCISEDELSRIDIDAFNRENPARRYFIHTAV